MGDIVYVNVELNQSTGEYEQPLAGEINYTSPIVERAGDYYAAIVRLTAPLNLPVWLPQMQLGGVTAGNTVYRVSILLGDDATAADKFGTAILNINDIPTRDDVPPFASQPSDLSNAIYSPLDVCRIFNKAFTAAFALIRDARPANAMPPVMYYNAATDSLGIYLFDCRCYAANTPDADRLTVYFSASLLNYVKTFPVKINNTHPSQSAAGNYMDIQLITDNLSDATVALSIPSVNTFAVAQNNSSFNYETLYENINKNAIAIFNPPPTDPADPLAYKVVSNIKSSISGSFTDAFNAVNAIRVNSSGLLQTNEIGAAPGTSSRTSHNLTSSNSPVLQDFIPNQTQGWNRRMLLYTADSVITGARFVELNGNSSISKFSISLSWLDVWGASHNLLSQSQSNNASVKIAFAKKSLFRL